MLNLNSWLKTVSRRLSSPTTQSRRHRPDRRFSSDLCLVQVLEPRRLLSAVTNTNDSGAGSFRQAIIDSNTTGGVDTISFAIPGAGVHTISLLSQLPDLTDAVIIDGTTQGVSATPLIELDGTSAGAGVNGLVITGGGSTVKGLAINRFTASGIRIQTLGGNTIQGNFIGTDAAGTADLGNGLHGIYNLNTPGNLIGGTTAGTGNVISGNDQHGVVIQGGITSSNVVQGNYIGTNAAGTAALGNTLGGILVQHSSVNTIGGTTAAERNIVSGNGANGVYLFGSGTSSTLVQGNYIGTDVNGTADLGNTLSGVQIDTGAASNTIGGTTAGARNIISGNNQYGVRLQTFGTTTNNNVQGNYIGTNVNGTAAVGNSLSGVHVNATGNTIGGTVAGAGNLISGNVQHGVLLQGGINVANNVQGNLIGTDVNGTADLGNLLSGVQVLNSSGNLIGGTTTLARNIISGNNENGIHLLGSGTSTTTVQGNYIGTNLGGTADLGNTLSGLLSTAANNAIGGTAAGAGNLISGNNRYGITIQGGSASGNTVEGNLIGTNAAGTGAIGNTLSGVTLYYAFSNTIGGTTASARNVISGNLQNGVYLSQANATNNLVQGNYIGTDLNGTADLGNALNGVLLDSQASANTIGGAAAGARNVISGNNQNGIYLMGDAAGVVTSNLIEGNYIGTDVNGTADLGNTQNGVLITQAKENTIGGTAAGAGNVISGNGQNGVKITSYANAANLVQGNRIGTNAAGTAALGNSLNGVQILTSTGNTIGGTTAGARNVISGNNQNGIHLVNNAFVFVSATVQGNYIGTNAAGTTDLGNTLSGVLVDGRASLIGGTAAGARNVISGNDRFGIEMVSGAAQNAVQGNYIGTNHVGTVAIGNSLSGVTINDGIANTIGGTKLGATNVISGNLENGVFLSGSGSTSFGANVLEGNRIGTNATGTADLGNLHNGVLISGAFRTKIGGVLTPLRVDEIQPTNLISANKQNGVHLQGVGTQQTDIQGNYIGTDASGTGPLGNAQAGVRISNAVSNTIGAPSSNSRVNLANSIAYNGVTGVTVTGSQSANNRISLNSIFLNTGLGIDLNGDGVTLNDIDDPDTGANKLQNFPVISSAVLSGSDLTVTYTVPSISPNSTFPIRVEFYIADPAGQEGQTLLAVGGIATEGSTEMQTMPAQSVVVGSKIVLTATDNQGNTSEFSAAFTVT